MPQRKLTNQAVAPCVARETLSWGGYRGVIIACCNVFDNSRFVLSAECHCWRCRSSIVVSRCGGQPNEELFKTTGYRNLLNFLKRGLKLSYFRMGYHFQFKFPRDTYPPKSYASIASYKDILWACHVIFLPHERLLKPRFVGEEDCATRPKNVYVGEYPPTHTHTHTHTPHPLPDAELRQKKMQRAKITWRCWLSFKEVLLLTGCIC